MADFYGNLKGLATKLLRQYGRDATLLRTTPGTYDSVTGEETGSTTEMLPAKGVLTDVHEDSRLAQGSTVMVGDRALLLEASFGLQKTDTITMDGQSWNIVHFLPLSPGDTVLLYEVHVRK